MLFFAHCFAFHFLSLFPVFFQWRSSQRFTLYSTSMSLTTLVDVMPLVLGPQGPQGKLLLGIFCGRFCRSRWFSHELISFLFSSFLIGEKGPRGKRGKRVNNIPNIHQYFHLVFSLSNESKAQYKQKHNLQGRISTIVWYYYTPTNKHFPFPLLFDFSHLVSQPIFYLIASFSHTFSLSAPVICMFSIFHSVVLFSVSFIFIFFISILPFQYKFIRKQNYEETKYTFTQNNK